MEQSNRNMEDFLPENRLATTFTADEAAKILGYNVVYLRRLAFAGSIPHIKRGRRIFFSRLDLEKIYRPIAEKRPFVDKRTAKGKRDDGGMSGFL